MVYPISVPEFRVRPVIAQGAKLGDQLIRVRIPGRAQLPPKLSNAQAGGELFDYPLRAAQQPRRRVPPLRPEHEPHGIYLERVVSVQLDKPEKLQNLTLTYLGKQQNVAAPVLADVTEISVALRIVRGLEPEIVVVAFQVPVPAAVEVQKFACKHYRPPSAQGVVEQALSQVGVKERLRCFKLQV